MLVKSYQNGQGRGSRDQTGQKGDHHPGTTLHSQQDTRSSSHSPHKGHSHGLSQWRERKKMLNKKYLKTIRSKFNKKLFLNRTKKQTDLRPGSEASSNTSLVSNFVLANQEAHSKIYCSFSISLQKFYIVTISLLPISLGHYTLFSLIIALFLFQIFLFH